MSTPSADLETVRQRLRDDVAGRFQTSDLCAVPENGLWPDVDYRARNHADWPPIRHLERLRRIACDPARSAEVGRGIDAWFDADPHCDNWWYNQLGVPIALGDVLLLADEYLTEAQRRTGSERLARAVWTDMAAQNLVWAAEGVIRRGLLVRDAAMVADALRRVASTLGITTGEGVQPDHSFHEHGPMLYFMGYGHDFVVDSSRLAYLASGTAFAFTADQVTVLADYLLDGSAWVVHGSTYDFTAMGRVVARPDAQDAWRELAGAAGHLLQVGTTRNSELEEFRRRVKTGLRRTGHKHFWRSDFSAHHRPTWSTSVKMSSTRTIPTETGNGEGLLSWYLGEGINPVWITGQEYRDIYPLWNWRRLPGLTAEQSTGPLPEQFWQKNPDGSDVRGGRSEVGGVSDGEFGLASMRLAKDAVVDGRKSWFCFDTGFVALGAGITAPEADDPVWTTVNQCLGEGTVRTGQSANGWTWVHHGRIAYFFPDGGRPVVRTETMTAGWSRINAALPEEPFSRDITTIAVDHGPRPLDAGYAYVVVPDVEDAEAPPITVLRNDVSIQAARHDGLGITQIAFHAAGDVDGIAADGPALVQLRDGLLSVADHTRRGGAVRIRAADHAVTVDLPEGERAGAPVSVPLSPDLRVR